MRNLVDYILESSQNNVYVVYFNDGIMDTFFNTREEAEDRKNKLNNEVSTNKCYVKEEPRSNFEQ